MQVVHETFENEEKADLVCLMNLWNIGLFRIISTSFGCLCFFIVLISVEIQRPTTPYPLFIVFLVLLDVV